MPYLIDLFMRIDGCALASTVTYTLMTITFLVYTLVVSKTDEAILYRREFVRACLRSSVHFRVKLKVLSLLNA